MRVEDKFKHENECLWWTGSRSPSSSLNFCTSHMERNETSVSKMGWPVAREWRKRLMGPHASPCHNIQHVEVQPLCVIETVQDAVLCTYAMRQVAPCVSAEAAAAADTPCELYRPTPPLGSAELNRVMTLPLSANATVRPCTSHCGSDNAHEHHGGGIQSLKVPHARTYHILELNIYVPWRR